MQLVVVSAVKAAVRAAMMIFATNSKMFCFFIRQSPPSALVTLPQAFHWVPAPLPLGLPPHQRP